MQAWTGVMLAGGALLVVTGVPKLRHPGPTITALRAVGAGWVGARTVRLLAAVEISCGASAVVLGGRWSDAAVGVVYTGFSAFLLRALTTPLASCGCTGRDDTPPTALHLLLTVTFAACAAAAVVAGGRTGLVSVAQATSTAPAVALASFAVLTAWLGWSVLTLSARAQATH
jgi:hypothetical protein